MRYEPPAIERRMPLNPPVIEGGVVGSRGPVFLSPIWKRPPSGASDTDSPPGA
jgi:hypothetical protein